MSPAERPVPVGVFCKPEAEATGAIQRVLEVLRQHGTLVLPDDNTAQAVGVPSAGSREDIAARSRLVVSVGGDGTLLATARAIGRREIPILGVNLGSLGFLTETRCEEVGEVLGAALEGRALIERRRVLQVTHDGEDPRPDSVALNDVVFSNQHMARLFWLSLFVDGEWVADYRADGLILATPTGSTAYNLAAGGPLLVPGVDALTVTPICPHSLSQRPLVVPGDARLSVRLAEGSGADGVYVTIDGQVGFPLEAGEQVDVCFAAHAVHLVRPGGRTFFSTLRGKLGWGHP